MTDANAQTDDHETRGCSNEEESEPSDNTTPVKKIELNAEFSSFLELRDAIEKYQKENSVQLIVKDSKLLKAESTRKIIPKVYHMVNQDLLYHSITYCCKCHGELKQKPGTRIKNVGQKRLNCPMYVRLKLSPDLKKLVLFDIDETHNHGIDPTTFQMTPRQQVYKLSRMRSKRAAMDEEDESPSDITSSMTSNIGEETGSDYKPPRKSARMKARADRRSRSTTEVPEEKGDEIEEDSDDDEDSISHLENQPTRLDSPLDSEESSCSDSDEEELRQHRALLPFPIRLIGSAIQSSPELLASTKQLIEIQKSKLLLEKQKLMLETKQLELMNSKLELEVRAMEKNLAAEMIESSQGRDTTIYLHAT